MIILKHAGGPVSPLGPEIVTRRGDLTLGRGDIIRTEQGEEYRNDIFFVRHSEESAALMGDRGVQQVSKQHARITFCNGAYELEDLGSSNGTFLDGEPVSTAQRLRKGHEIRLGGRSGPRMLVDLGWDPPPDALESQATVSPWQILLGTVLLVLGFLALVAVMLTTS